MSTMPTSDHKAQVKLISIFFLQKVSATNEAAWNTDKKIDAISFVSPSNNFTETVPDTSYIIVSNNIYHNFQH